MHPRKEAGIVLDFVPKARDAQRARRLAALAARRRLLPRGRRVTPAPRRRAQRRARRRLSPAPWLVRSRPTSAPPRRDPAGVAAHRPEVPRRRRAALLGDDRGRQIRFDQRAEFARKFAEGRAGKGALETFLAVCAAENPNRRLRMTALADRVATPVERADFDDLVTLVTQAPPWEKDRAAGVRMLLRASATARRTHRADPRPLDVAARARDPEDPGPAGEPGVPGGEAAARRGRELTRPPARGERRRTRSRSRCAAASGRRGAARLGRGLHAARQRPARPAREELGSIEEIANGLAENLPLPKAPARKSRRRRRQEAQAGARTGADGSDSRRPRPSPTPEPRRPRPRSKTRRPSGRYADGSSSSFFSRSRRKRVSSAAIESPDGQLVLLGPVFEAVGTRSSSSTYAAVSGSDATASLTCSA